MPACAIVGASDFNSNAFLMMKEAGMFDHVIAVDAGFKWLEDIGQKPDFALGDFDSLGYKPRGIRISTYSADKDKSDMELAIDRAKAKHFDTLFIFGALGRRLDHTLANLQVFSQASSEGIKVCAIGESETVFFLTGPDILELDARDDGIISVFAMDDKVEGLFERGLKWELDNVELKNRSSLGLSNKFIGEPVLVGVEKGTIAIIVNDVS